jgi:hypothetical protein
VPYPLRQLKQVDICECLQNCFPTYSMLFYQGQRVREIWGVFTIFQKYIAIDRECAKPSLYLRLMHRSMPD